MEIVENFVMENFRMHESIISEVKKRPYLYDVRRKDYKSKQLKKVAFQEIGLKLGMPASEANAKWRYLRDKFVKERKKVVNGPTDDTNSKSKWVCYESLTFLLPFIGNKSFPICTNNNPGEVEVILHTSSDSGDSPSYDTIPSTSHSMSPVSYIIQSQPNAEQSQSNCHPIVERVTAYAPWADDDNLFNDPDNCNNSTASAIDGTVACGKRKMQNSQKTAKQSKADTTMDSSYHSLISAEVKRDEIYYFGCYVVEVMRSLDEPCQTEARRKIWSILEDTRANHLAHKK